MPGWELGGIYEPPIPGNCSMCIYQKEQQPSLFSPMVIPLHVLVAMDGAILPKLDLLQAGFRLYGAQGKNSLAPFHPSF